MEQILYGQTGILVTICIQLDYISNKKCIHYISNINFIQFVMYSISGIIM